MKVVSIAFESARTLSMGNSDAAMLFPQVDILAEDEFVVLACDGLLEVLSSQRVVQFVKQFLLEGNTAEVRYCSFVTYYRHFSKRFWLLHSGFTELRYC